DNSHATRRVKTVVLPLPAPATTSDGPQPRLTASACCVFNLSSNSCLLTAFSWELKLVVCKVPPSSQEMITRSFWRALFRTGCRKTTHLGPLESAFFTTCKQPT